MKFPKKCPLSIVLSLAIFLCLSEGTSATLRLPNDTIPINYDLHLTTNIHSAEFHFAGRVDVLAKCLNKTNRITVHSLDLEIRRVSVNGAPVNEKHFQLEEQKQFLHINLAEKLREGQLFNFSIEYVGSHNDMSVGWFRANLTKTE